MILKSYIKGNRKLWHLLSIFVFVLISSCSSTKYISDEQSVVRKVTIDSLNESLSEQAYNYVQKDIIPGGRISFYRVLYNLFNVKDGKYRTDKIRNIGSPPSLLDSSLVELSRKQIEKFLKSKGYLNATVRDSIFINNKNAKIFFIAKSKAPFIVKDVSVQIPDTNLKKIYYADVVPDSKMLIGSTYDEDDLGKIRERIYEELQYKGYYGFLRQYIRFEVDTNFNNSTAKVNLYVDNPENKTAHPQFMLGHSNVVIAKNSEGFVGDSVAFNPVIEDGIRFSDASGRFRRNAILRYDFLKTGNLYNTQNESLTLDRMYQLNAFKNVKIEYTKNKDSLRNIIHPLIMLTPYKLMSNRIDVELPFNRDIVGLNVGNTFSHSNVFGGAEKLELQVGGGFYAYTGENIFANIYQRNFSASANLSVPRLLVPFSIPLIAKNGVPHTTFSSSYIYNLQKDVLIRRIFIGTLTYDWVETKSKLHSFSPLNLEYRFGQVLLDSANAATLQKNSSYNYELLNRKNVTLGIKYTYDLNSDKLPTDKSFVYFRGSFESSGNLLGTIAKLQGQKFDPNNQQFAKFLGLQFNQYIRPEIDIRWYKNLGYEKTFIARLNAGVGYTYGNSTQLPFEKMFFAGGSTGIRAWQARTLGPGNYNRSIWTDPNIRRLLIGIDQLGDLLIQGNLEYRFMLANNFAGGKIKGAVFLDGGNVWALPTNDPIDQATGREFTFNFKRLLSQTALGTGLGIRYDVDYFVFRLDVGLKVKDPQFGGNNQWVIKDFISNSAAFKKAYDETNSPDHYRFLQYNFGIGLPF